MASYEFREVVDKYGRSFGIQVRASHSTVSGWGRWHNIEKVVMTDAERDTIPAGGLGGSPPTELQNARTI